MNDLVQRLSEDTHPVIVGGARPTLADFQQRVSTMGYVFIKFPDTRGGTDLGIQVDHNATDLSQANFEQGNGTVHLEGTLVLNYTRVRCIADIDLQTLSGHGKLRVLETVPF